MRLRGFEVAAFGRLVDFRAADLVDAPVVVLLGNNESGKTTFFEFVTTALFSFRPATRDNHPYDPWTGAVPEGSLDLRLADGSDVTVRRRLRGHPDGRATMRAPCGSVWNPGASRTPPSASPLPIRAGRRARPRRSRPCTAPGWRRMR